MKNFILVLTLLTSLTVYAKDDIGGGGSLGGGGKLTDMMEDFKIPAPEKDVLKSEQDLENAFKAWDLNKSQRDKDELLRKVFKHHIVPQIGK